MKKYFLINCVFIFFIFSCKKSSLDSDEKNGMVETPIALNIPQFFPNMVIPDDNKMTAERLILGRKLYYDPILSNNGKSCSSCHLQEKGFTSDVTSGFTVLPHINLGWNHNFLWQGGESGQLEDVMLFEVNDFFATDLSKLNANETYKELFKKAYGVKEITSKEVAYALAQFFRSMISGNSKFDKFRKNEVTLNVSEMRGMNIFYSEKGDCFHCHGGMLFTDNDFHNTGLDASFAPSNQGRYEITKNPNDIGLYKTPTLRNSGVRNQFMHDGRFSTLLEVIDFYNNGFHKNSPNIDPLMIIPEKENGLQLTAQDKADLVAFLNTLTDLDFLSDTSLSKP